MKKRTEDTVWDELKKLDEAHDAARRLLIEERERLINESAEKLIGRYFLVENENVSACVRADRVVSRGRLAGFALAVYEWGETSISDHGIFDPMEPFTEIAEAGFASRMKAAICAISEKLVK